MQICTKQTCGGADLQGADLRGADLHKAKLEEAKLQMADLRGAKVRNLSAYRADLRGANLRGGYVRVLNLVGSDLRDADLHKVDLSGEKHLGSVSWTWLSGANLRGVDLSDANLSWVDFHKADLRNVNLRAANMEEADLREARLQNADLRGANLHKADLRGANLQGANLNKAKDIHKANLQGANLSGVIRQGTRLDSGLGILGAAIGIAGGAAIVAAGRGSEEALAAGTVFAEGVIGGQPTAGSSGGGHSSSPTSADGSSGEFDIALRNLENSCGERYRSGFFAQDHGRFYCLDAFARYCALKQGHNQQHLDALKHDFEVLRSQGQESRCPYFGVLSGTYNENPPAPQRPKSAPKTKAADPVTQKRSRTTCTDGDTVPIAVERGEKPGCPPGRWCTWNACRSDECRQRYPECAPGVLR